MNSRGFANALAVILVCGSLSITTKTMTEQSHSSPTENLGSFSVFKGEMDGYPLLATIDMGLRHYKKKSNVPWFLSISTPLVKPTSDGLTTTQEAEELDKWEDALEKDVAAATHFVYVGHVTWKGHRELLYYIAKPDPVKRTLQSLIDHRTTRPFAFRCERDDTWSKVEVYFKKSS